MNQIYSIRQQKEDLRQGIAYLDMIAKACQSEHPVFGKAEKVTLRKPENFTWAWNQVRSLLEEKELIPNSHLDGLCAMVYTLDEMHELPMDFPKVLLKGERKDEDL